MSSKDRSKDGDDGETHLAHASSRARIVMCNDAVDHLPLMLVDDADRGTAHTTRRATCGDIGAYVRRSVPGRPRIASSSSLSYVVFIVGEHVSGISLSCGLVVYRR